MEDNLLRLLRQKLVDGITMPLPVLTRRDTWIPRVAGKVLAVIGMRRSGKTSLLWQELGDRLANPGMERSGLPWISLEDERLIGAGPELLDAYLEIWFSQHPQWRQPQPGKLRPCLFLDEVQVIPGWEGFVRRVIDTEPLDVVVSGSSAQMLSAEIATNLRGRAVETLLWPFSFREALRHQRLEPSITAEHWSSAERSSLQHQLERYLLEGGFPEVQGLDARSRRSLLLSYVDSTVLRDVMERRNIRNPLALQWLVRQLLAHAGGAFSVNKLHQAMRSQGLAISREHLTELVQHLEQAFLITSLVAGGGSLRRTQSLPRKIYPIDPGLIPLYDRSGRASLGHALETVVTVELRRRGAELSYLRSESGREVDALALLPDGQKLLVQVCASLHDADTREREVTSLLELADTPTGRSAEPVLISLDARPPDLGDAARRLRWRPAIDWLLDDQT